MEVKKDDMENRLEQIENKLSRLDKRIFALTKVDKRELVEALEKALNSSERDKKLSKISVVCTMILVVNLITLFLLVMFTQAV